MLYNPSVKIGQSPKLHCPWEKDPYTVLQKISDIDYKIQRGRSKSKIVHFNRLKLYIEPQDIAEWPARDLQDEQTRPVLSRVPGRFAPNPVRPLSRFAPGRFAPIPVRPHLLIVL
jgi:hypothetical protein